MALAAIVAVACAAAAAVPRATAPESRPPKLAVVVMVDQMRADYVDRFEADWTSGLKRLVTRGAWFRNAAYPYLSTVTCAGHATVATGTFPHVHGINADFRKTWTRLLPESRYRTPDDGEAEAAPRGWTKMFPHALTGAGGDRPDPFFYQQWGASPFADAYLGRLAAALAESMKLG